MLSTSASQQAHLEYLEPRNLYDVYFMEVVNLIIVVLIVSSRCPSRRIEYFVDRERRNGRCEEDNKGGCKMHHEIK